MILKKSGIAEYAYIEGLEITRLSCFSSLCGFCIQEVSEYERY
jgi:hypothetical protein